MTVVKASVLSLSSAMVLLLGNFLYLVFVPASPCLDLIAIYFKHLRCVRM